MKNIGIALKEHFKAQKMTQQQVADRLGVTQPFIGRVFRGEYSFGKKAAREWANAFGFSYSFLLSGEGTLFDNDASLLHEMVTEDLEAGLDPDTPEYWKNKYDELLADYNKAQGTIEGLRMALAALGGTSAEKV